MKYKVGDKVRIVSKWPEDGIQNSDGLMDKWLGKTMTIKAEILGGYFMKEDQRDRPVLGGWLWSDDLIEGLAQECKQKIVITSDGVETLARLYDGKRVVARGVAKCSPEDTFDFMTGAKLATERLTAEKPEPEKKVEYKPGDWVRIVGNTSPRHFYEIGDTVKVLRGRSGSSNYTSLHLHRPWDGKKQFVNVKDVELLACGDHK
jgi:hypothetical protein